MDPVINFKSDTKEWLKKIHHPCGCERKHALTYTGQFILASLNT